MREIPRDLFVIAIVKDGKIDRISSICETEGTSHLVYNAMALKKGYGKRAIQVKVEMTHLMRSRILEAIEANSESTNS